MQIKVRYISEEEIENEAELLLAEYAETIGAAIKLPVPVDEITTYHLALRLGFADLHETLRIPRLRDQPDILGAIWVDEEAILIDQSLDPKKNPAMTGRYRFSVAHEVGHWRLHRSYVAKDANRASLFGDSPEPTVICRSSQAMEPIEWQANFFASCSLMPKGLVMAEWERLRGSVRPVVFDWKRSEHFNPSVTIDGKPITAESANVLAVLDFDKLAEPIARRCQVSVQAMRIRLEKLGLLLRHESR
jgi:hypothetical protein